MTRGHQSEALSIRGIFTIMTLKCSYRKDQYTTITRLGMSPTTILSYLYIYLQPKIRWSYYISDSLLVLWTGGQEAPDIFIHASRSYLCIVYGHLERRLFGSFFNFGRREKEMCRTNLFFGRIFAFFLVKNVYTLHLSGLMLWVIISGWHRWR